MTTKLKVPALLDAINELADLALIYPDCTNRHAYVDAAGQPHDLFGHALLAQGLDPAYFTIRGGLLKRDGSRGLNNTRYISSIWSEVYTRDALFLGLKDNEAMARDLLVYWLYARVQKAIDRGHPWKLAVRKGLQSFKSLVNHANSGFLVQTHGSWPHLVTEANLLADEAIARLK